jgi:phospholipase C
LILGAMLAGCAGSSVVSIGPARFVPMVRTPHGCGSSSSSSCMPIQHVVVIVQENRSFVNLFAGYPGADAPTSGPMSNGRIVPLRQIDFQTTDLDHSYGASVNDYDGGKMDRFDQNYTGKGKQAGGLAYSYLARGLVKPYWDMAQQYTLADRMFADEHGASWTSHLDIIGTTNLTPNAAVVDFPSNSPWDCDAPKNTVTPEINAKGQYHNRGPRPCFTEFRTMADTLDNYGISWRFYAPKINGDIGGIWSPFGAIANVRYGPDWATNVVHPPSQILSDVANGYLAGVTWVTPEWNWSDHAGGGATMGPSWVAAVVNAIGQSQYWNNTAIVVVWDDWGGFYDDAAPPQVDFKGLGLRVGCIIVSPYAQAGYVSHTTYEFGSINAFIEQVFGLPPLGSPNMYPDARANSIIDSFNFAQTPITFQPISAPIPPSQFVKMPESGKVPDSE